MKPRAVPLQDIQLASMIMFNTLLNSSAKAKGLRFLSNVAVSQALKRRASGVTDSATAETNILAIYEL